MEQEGKVAKEKLLNASVPPIIFSANDTSAVGVILNAKNMETEFRM